MKTNIDKLREEVIMELRKDVNLLDRPVEDWNYLVRIINKTFEQTIKKDRKVILKDVDNFRHRSKYLHSPDDCDCCERNLKNIEEIKQLIGAER